MPLPLNFCERNRPSVSTSEALSVCSLMLINLARSGKGTQIK